MIRRSLVAACLIHASASFAAPVAFIDVNVVPMDRERVLAHQTVLVDHGVVTTVGPAARVRVPAGARRIAAQGKFLLPGLVDMHVHLANPTELPLYLANGVTTVFNLNGAPAHLAWRARVAHGELVGPRIVTAGPWMNVARSPADSAKFVDQIADAGYDAVKVYSQVSAAEYPALVAEARKRKLLLMGHVAWQVGLDETLKAGQAIAHEEELLYSAFNPGVKDGHIGDVVLDEAKIVPVAQQVARSGVFLTPTLIAFRDIEKQATTLPAFLQDPHFGYQAPWINAMLQPSVNNYANRYNAKELRFIHEGQGFMLKLTRALHDAGVPLLAGTDATMIGPIAGFSLQEELALLASVGLTPYQVLQTATVNPARYFGSTGGTIAAKSTADLLLVDANPLADISNAGKVHGVMVGGRWYGREQLDAMLAAVPAEHLKLRDRLIAVMLRDPKAGAAALSDADPMGAMGGQVMLALQTQQGEAAFERIVDGLRASDPSAPFTSEDSYNNLGYAFLAENKLEPALYILKKNSADFPRSANAADSLADAYTHANDLAHAREHYQRALQLDPSYINAAGARKFLAEHP
ncbi:MAG: amidohydrolase family protein [Telluria sp.]